jgi:hypothetical protein
VSIAVKEPCVSTGSLPGRLAAEPLRACGNSTTVDERVLLPLWIVAVAAAVLVLRGRSLPGRTYARHVVATSSYP